MGILSKTKITLCSIIAAMALNCGSPSEVPKQNINDTIIPTPKAGTAIMITGNDSIWANYDAFRNGNEILAEHFQRSFNIINFYSKTMREMELHEMIREATKNSESIIISYNGHGAPREMRLVDNVIADAIYFPLGSVLGGALEENSNLRREGLRRPVRQLPQTPTAMSRDEYEDLFRRLDEMNLPSTGFNLEYVQFYNPSDNELFPQEVLLLLSNFKGKIAFITNSCFAGQVNELVRRDPNLQALALASSPYNEVSMFSQSVGASRRGGHLLSRALAVYFNLLNNGKRINLAEVLPEDDGFITFARMITSHPIGSICKEHNSSVVIECENYQLRDEGFNFQRYSRINEFYF